MYKYPLFTQHDRQPKTSKNKKLNVHTRILHLAPARSSGVMNACPMASAGCEAACLNWSGYHYSRKQNARVAKTKMFVEHRDEFMKRLYREIKAAKRYADKRGMRCGIRLNGTSDIRWEREGFCGYRNLMQAFPDVCFYDYTKLANRKNLPSNYRLTFSRSENNDKDCLKALENGMNVAVVFGMDYLPKKFMRLPVIDGDEHDFRYDDPRPCIVGLQAKGHKADQDETGFIFRN